MTKLIEMIRSTEDAKGGPTEADVHPDEIENYKKGGWIIKEKKEPEKIDKYKRK